MLLPEEMRLKVADITMDLSNSMGSIAKSAFPKAVIIRDCFHVIQRCGEGIEEIRLRLKREAIKEQKKEKAEFRRNWKGWPNNGRHTARRTSVQKERSVGVNLCAFLHVSFRQL